MCNLIKIIWRLIPPLTIVPLIRPHSGPKRKEKLCCFCLFCLASSRFIAYISMKSTNQRAFIGHPLFFLCLASSDRPKFHFQKKSNDVVKPFFSWNNSFNLKNGHTNSTENNRNKNMDIFYSILCIFLNPNMWMLTFNVVLGYQSLFYSETSSDFVFSFFFQSDRPTQYQKTYSTLNEKKSEGDGLRWKLRTAENGEHSSVTATITRSPPVIFPLYLLPTSSLAKTRGGSIIKPCAKWISKWCNIR